MQQQEARARWGIGAGRGEVEGDPRKGAGAHADECRYAFEERLKFRSDFPPPLPRRVKIFLYMSRRPTKRPAPNPPLQRARSLDDLFPRLTYGNPSPSSSVPEGSSVSGNDATSDCSDTVSRNSDSGATSSGDSCFDQNESISYVSEIAEDKPCATGGRRSRAMDSSFDNDDLSDEGIDVGRAPKSLSISLKNPKTTLSKNEPSGEFHFDEITSSPEHTYEEVEDLFGCRGRNLRTPPKVPPPPPLPPGTRPPRKNSREGGKLKSDDAGLRSQTGVGYTKRTYSAESRPILDTDSSTTSAKPARPPRTRKSRLTLAKHMSTPNLSQGHETHFSFQQAPRAPVPNSGVIQYALANAFRVSTSPREIASSVASLAAVSEKPLPYFDLPHEIPVKPIRTKSRTKQRMAPLPPTEIRNSQEVHPPNTHEGNQSPSLRHGQHRVPNQPQHNRKKSSGADPGLRPELRIHALGSRRASSCGRSRPSGVAITVPGNKHLSTRREQNPQHGRKPSEGSKSPSKASVSSCKSAKPSAAPTPRTRGRSFTPGRGRNSFSTGSSPIGPTQTRPDCKPVAPTRPRGTSLPPRGRTCSTSCFNDSTVPTYVFPGPVSSDLRATKPSNKKAPTKGRSQEEGHTSLTRTLSFSHENVTTGTKASTMSAQGCTLTRQRTKNQSFLHSVEGRKTTQRNS